MTTIDDIERIQLPDLNPDPGNGQTPAANDSRVEVNEGALIAFADGMDRQAAQDVENSVLFAQLAADHNSSRTADPTKWWTDFLSTLSIVGWSTQKSINDAAKLGGPVDWLSVAVQKMPADAAKEVTAAVKAADALAYDSTAATIWSKAVTSVSSALFILVSANSDDSGPSLELQATSFGFSPLKTRFLTWDLGYDARLRWLSMELSEDIYSKVRSTIIKKLGDRPRYLIATVPLDKGE